MSLLMSDKPQIDMKDLPGAVKALSDYVYMLREELEYVVLNLDSQNVTSIDTNITKVKSADGSTEIIGNILTMTDTKRKRLLLGYDKVHKRFQFEMYDQNKLKTLYMDDDGQVQLRGKPLLKMYDNNSILRAMLGYDPELEQFVFELNDTTGAHAIYFNDDGEAVYAGNIQTAKNATVGNNLYIGVEGVLEGKGIYFYNSGAGKFTRITMNTFADMLLQGYRNVDIQAFNGDIDIRTMAGGGAVHILSYNHGFSLGGSADDSEIRQSVAGNLLITNAGDGDTILETSGGGTIKLNAISNMDVILSAYSYLGSTASGNRVATIADIQQAIRAHEEDDSIPNSHV